MAHPFPRVEAAAIDGRLHTVYHRQFQLEKLCAALIENVNQIKEAIETDYGHSLQEIAFEYHQTLTAVKQYYALLRPKEALEEEYLIANGKDAVDNRAPAGMVYIEPTTHTLFYSSVVPLAGAIAAGNCVVLLLENNLRSLSGTLRRILSDSLDADLFVIASTPVKDEAFVHKSICVVQNGVQELPRINQLTTLAEAPVVAIVDRTADINLAARELVAARFSFGGSSPYATDVVLVNEFRKKEFLDAAVSKAVRISNDTGHKSKPNNHLAALQKFDPSLRIIHQDSNSAIIDLPSRENVLKSKVSAPILAVHSISSLDDAIDLISSKITVDKPCLAAYHFSNASTGKYLSQFIHASHTFINHIPKTLLLGPPIPSGTRTSERYPVESFTLPRPVHINKLKSKLQEDPVVLMEEATTPLREFKRHPGGGVGFFEQGFLINAGIIVVSTLTCTVMGGFWLWRWSRAT